MKYHVPSKDSDNEEHGDEHFALFRAHVGDESEFPGEGETVDLVLEEIFVGKERAAQRNAA